jgi:hypothetical protein
VEDLLQLNNLEDLFFDISKFKSPFAEDTVLTTGKYQIPIFCQEYYQKKPFLYKEQLKLDRLPGSSLLIRIKEAVRDKFSKKLLSTDSTPKEQWEEKGLVIPKPNYHTGVYDSSQMALNESEKGLFEILKERKNVPVLEKAIRVLITSGQFQDVIRYG